ncbi:MAG: DUF896 domain-containing protein [Clostridiales bacterium]|nr:DUF896 domain-containing protein [Clostridiales bacterium]
MTQDKIDMINALARKAKTVGLTDEEAALQKRLREEYIAECRRSLEEALRSTTIVYPDGTRKKLRPKDKAET